MEKVNIAASNTVPTYASVSPNVKNNVLTVTQKAATRCNETRGANTKVPDMYGGLPPPPHNISKGIFF